MTDEQKPSPAPSHVAIWAEAAVLASPKFAGSLHALYKGYEARRTARVAETLEEVARYCDPQVLADRLGESEELEETFARAVEVAAGSTLAAKRRLLGRVVSRAVLDDARVDEAALLTNVLAQVEAVHIRCLESVHRAKQEALAADEIGPTARGAEQAISQRVIDAAGPFPAPVLTTLVGLGLLDASSSWDGNGLVKGPTVFGEQLLTDLHAAS